MKHHSDQLTLVTLQCGDDPLGPIRAALADNGIQTTTFHSRFELERLPRESLGVLAVLEEQHAHWSELTLSYPVLWFTPNYRPETAAELAISGQVLLPIDLPEDLLLRSLSRLVAGRDGAEFLGQRYRLSPQETRLLKCMMRGMNREESAEAIGCGVQTIPSYWNRIFRKAGVRTQRELLLLYIQALRPSLLPQTG